MTAKPQFGPLLETGGVTFRLWAAHVGPYTPQGRFRAIIEKLDHLVETGVTALELMPLADFPGRWNWGYDGVLLFAPDSAYGRREDLKALVDAAHARSLMIFLDAVYNHFGPEGDYLRRIAPSFFSDAHTPWGSATDYTPPEARAFVIENALHWLGHYRFDGLRRDAVHAIVSPGKPEILHDLSVAVGRLAAATGRHIHLVIENDDNRAALPTTQEDPPAGHYRAQWNDDYHHAWHVLLTGESRGHYRAYQDPANAILRSLAEGLAYQVEASPRRKGAIRGEPSRYLPRAAFVDFIQNHDQIGNRRTRRTIDGARLGQCDGSGAHGAAVAARRDWLSRGFDLRRPRRDCWSTRRPPLSSSSKRRHIAAAAEQLGSNMLGNRVLARIANN